MYKIPATIKTDILNRTTNYLNYLEDLYQQYPTNSLNAAITNTKSILRVISGTVTE